MQQYQNLLFHIYMKLIMFLAIHRPSLRAQNFTSSLWFCIRERLLDVEVAGRCQRPATSKQFQNAKPDTRISVLELLSLSRTVFYDIYFIELYEYIFW
jgi:hypothetical protein